MYFRCCHPADPTAQVTCGGGTDKTHQPTGREPAAQSSPPVPRIPRRYRTRGLRGVQLRDNTLKGPRRVAFAHAPCGPVGAAPVANEPADVPGQNRAGLASLGASRGRRGQGSSCRSSRGGVVPALIYGRSGIRGDVVASHSLLRERQRPRAHRMGAGHRTIRRRREVEGGLTASLPPWKCIDRESVGWWHSSGSVVFVRQSVRANGASPD
jgi:hypothetical protein